MTVNRESHGLIGIEEDLERAKSVLVRRQEIMGAPFPPDQLPPNPIDLFTDWYENAQSVGVEMPETMTIATVGADGIPTIRNISMRGRDDVSFHFWTNLKSTKGQGLNTHGRPAVLFNWIPIRRNVKIAGIVEPSTELSDKFWSQIPPFIQVGLDKAQQVKKRADYDAELAEVAAKGEMPEPLARPDSFVAFRLFPDVIEFWQQGYHNLLGDRFRYTRDDLDASGAERTPGDKWTLDLLSPW